VGGRFHAALQQAVFLCLAGRRFFVPA